MVHNRQDRDLVDEYLDELELLADTAGAEILYRVIQERDVINPLTQANLSNLLKQLIILTLSFVLTISSIFSHNDSIKTINFFQSKIIFLFKMGYLPLIDRM